MINTLTKPKTEKNKLSYMDYAHMATDSIVQKYKPEELPPAGTLHYHAGVFLNGMLNLYKEEGDEKYYRYIKGYIDGCVDDMGVIKAFDGMSFDDIQAGTLLFPIIEKEENSEKYERALMTCMSMINSWQKDPDGGFWHKSYLKNQMWLDAIYMVSGLQLMFSKKYGYHSFTENVYKQAFLMYERLKTDSGLLYHAFSYDKDQAWCNPVTGCSYEVWARSLGWYTLTAADILEFDKENTENKKRLARILNGILKSLIKYRDEKTNMWYQIVDKPDGEGNWVESSASALFVYSIAKAIRLGVLESEYAEYAIECFDGIIKNAVDISENRLNLNLICPGTGVGSYEQYIERPKSSNDLHGMGPFILMCVEMKKMFKIKIY